MSQKLVISTRNGILVSLRLPQLLCIIIIPGLKPGNLKLEILKENLSLMNLKAPMAETEVMAVWVRRQIWCYVQLGLLGSFYRIQGHLMSSCVDWVWRGSVRVKAQPLPSRGSSSTEQQNQCQ